VSSAGAGAPFRSPPPMGARGRSPTLTASGGAPRTRDRPSPRPRTRPATGRQSSAACPFPRSSSAVRGSTTSAT
jgi:hypothetical protein